jgi:hypothetical protein
MRPLQIRSLGELQQNIAAYQEKVNLCYDAINMLRGMTPEDFLLTFTIKGSPVLSFPIDENEADVAMAFFTYYYQFFGRTLDKLKKMLPDEVQPVL